MIDAIATCPTCDRSLPRAPAIEYRTRHGTRRVYECVCGRVTISVVGRTAGV